MVIVVAVLELTAVEVAVVAEVTVCVCITVFTAVLALFAVADASAARYAAWRAAFWLPLSFEQELPSTPSTISRAGMAMIADSLRVFFILPL